jgi:DedD protein
LNVANQIQDDGFHEIQLNGKQLVFLFMAATVVSVVIFLCGVLVGRGVRAERPVADSTVATNADPTPAPPPSTPAQPPAGSDPTAAPPPPPTSEDLSYYRRLEKPTPAQEQLKPPAAEHKAPAAEHKAPTAERKPPAAPREAAATIGKSPAPPAVERRAREPEPTAPREAAPSLKEAPKETPKAGAADPPPAGDGFAVQIAALNVRSEADAIAKRLSSKGYAAYVMSPANGTPSVYRVRVGKFPTRREAESIAAKLQKEEQFKPWVTR